MPSMPIAPNPVSSVRDGNPEITRWKLLPWITLTPLVRPKQVLPSDAEPTQSPALPTGEAPCPASATYRFPFGPQSRSRGLSSPETTVVHDVVEARATPATAPTQIRAIPQTTAQSRRTRIFPPPFTPIAANRRRTLALSVATRSP